MQGTDTSTECLNEEWGVLPKEADGAVGTKGAPHAVGKIGKAFWEWYPKWHPHSHAQFQRFY